MFSKKLLFNCISYFIVTFVSISFSLLIFPSFNIYSIETNEITLEEAFKQTLLNLYKGPEFVDLKTALPYETISLTERRPSETVITGDDVTEMHTPYWIYYLATGDEDIEAIICTVVESMLKYLDPGTGLIGSYRYDTIQGALLDIDRVKQDAEHGGEALMYSVFPYAWCFKSEKAIVCLENFARAMLECNKDPRYIHFHLYIERLQNGTWIFKDYGKVDPNPDAYCDIMEFWWVLPTLEAAVVTENATLRDQIVERVKLIMDNMIDLQDSTGRLPTVYRMDGSSGYWGKWGLDEAWEPSPDAFSRWIQASYIMHHLTRDEKYIHVLNRFWDWYFNYWDYMGRASEYNVIGEYIFHSYYTGNSTYIPKIYEWASSLGSSTQNRDEVWMIAKALYYAISGDEEALEQALEAEQYYRRINFREYLGYYFYLDPSGHGIASEGDVDFLFRGYISNLILLKNRGQQVHGLLYRDLLALGWLIPEIIHGPYIQNGKIYERYIAWLYEDINNIKLKKVSANEYIAEAEEYLDKAIIAYQNGDYVQVKEYVIQGFNEIQKYRLKIEGEFILSNLLISLFIAIAVLLLVTFHRSISIKLKFYIRKLTRLVDPTLCMKLRDLIDGSQI